jgi:hypothetical protein
MVRLRGRSRHGGDDTPSPELIQTGFTVADCSRRVSPFLRHRNILADAPPDACGINNHEVAHTPWPVFRWLALRAVLGCKSLSLDVTPPCINIIDQQMDHELPACSLLSRRQKRFKLLVAINTLNSTLRAPNSFQERSGFDSPLVGEAPLLRSSNVGSRSRT